MEQKSFFASPRWLLPLVLLFMFGLALTIRVYDITDLPLDFHPARQLFSAIKSRGMFYETLPDIPNEHREFAIRQWKTKVTIEPEVVENIAVFFYRLTGKEQLWIPRMTSAIFWLIGGIFVFLLARDLVSIDGALLSLAFYLFVPYGIFASRSFQPDPLMVLIIVAFWWLIFRWASQPGWKWAILAGLMGGVAIFVKFVAVFFILGGALGALFRRYKPQELIRNPQAWVIGVLGVIPGAAWIIYGKFVLGIFGGDVSGRFIPTFLVSPIFYIQWQDQIAMVASGIGFMFGLLGLLIVKGRAKTFLLGIWGSYVVFGLYFNYHISTHDYYSLTLLPIVALSLAVLGDKFFSYLADNIPEWGAGSGWVRSAFSLILVYGLLSAVWDIRNEMKSVDYRPQEAMWLEIGETLQGSSIEALTQGYGTFLAYWGWQNATIWPSSGILYQADARGNSPDIDKLFNEAVDRKSYFLVTDMDDFAKQPELRARLADYTIVKQGDGYLIYDLQRPLESLP